jgi:hypothetical protein
MLRERPALKLFSALRKPRSLKTLSRLAAQNKT